MTGIRFAFGFGIALILPLLIYYGVATFVPEPRWEDYQIKDYYTRHRNATPEEKIQLEKQQNELTEKKCVAMKHFYKCLFFVSVPVGLAAIILGTYSSVPYIGAGLVFGGLFSIIQGYGMYWGELSDPAKFVSLLISLALLLYLGYKKIANRKAE